MVGRGGLEPPTSAIVTSERCAWTAPKLTSNKRCSRCYVAAKPRTYFQRRPERENRLVRYLAHSDCPANLQTLPLGVTR